MATPIPCDPSSLALAATQYDGMIPDGEKGAVIIYLLNQIAGTGLTPQQLALNAACYDAYIPKGMQPAVMNYLLCAIANASGA